MKTSRVSVLLALAVAACNSADAANWGGSIVDSAGVAVVSNPAEGDWSLRAAPTITEDLDIGTVEGEAVYQFGQVVGLDVNEAGEILVLDSQAREVRVFDGSGTHVRTLGKPGGGPGELSQAVMAVAAGPAGGVYIADLMRQRIVGLDSSGAEVASIDMTIRNGIPMRFQSAPGGRIAVQVRRMALPGETAPAAPPRDFVILHEPAAGSADTIVDVPSGESISFGPSGPRVKVFSSEMVWALLPEGRVVRAQSDAYRLEVFSAAGALERVITRPYERLPVTDADRETYRSLMRKVSERQLSQQFGDAVPPQAMAMIDQMVKAMEFADWFPAFANIMAGPENTIWVQRYPTDIARVVNEQSMPSAEDLGSPDWDVFDEQGRLLGHVTLPARFNPLRTVGNAAYGTRLDELDVQHVVRLRMDW